ncbi:hypothetical protein TNCV_4497591 [Trichonephila clavipes]|nr:hypothetical protein TNCV_4497591 [Trichonephila clavipes]
MFLSLGEKDPQPEVGQGDQLEDMQSSNFFMDMMQVTWCSGSSFSCRWLCPPHGEDSGRMEKKDYFCSLFHPKAPFTPNNSDSFTIKLV